MNNDAWKIDLVTAVLNGRTWSPRSEENDAVTLIKMREAALRASSATLASQLLSNLIPSTHLSEASRMREAETMINKGITNKVKTVIAMEKPPMIIRSSSDTDTESELMSDHSQTSASRVRMDKNPVLPRGNSHKSSSTRQTSKLQPLDILIRAVCQNEAKLNAKSETSSQLVSDEDSPKKLQRSEAFVFHQTAGEIATVQRDDVLLGRTKTAMRHPGNQRFRELVRQYRETYQSTPLRDEKFHTINEIITVIRQRGGRFLKQNKEGLWCQVTIDDAYTKVSHALRMARALGGHKKRDLLQRNRELEFIVSKQQPKVSA